jgi:CheY-like chemotaxis protein
MARTGIFRCSLFLIIDVMAGLPNRSQSVVLIVEDEPLLRMLAVEVVEEAGFVALEAGDAYEAVALLESRPDISVLFTDINMPGSMDGLKLAHAVRDRWPPIKSLSYLARFGCSSPNFLPTVALSGNRTGRRQWSRNCVRWSVLRDCSPQHPRLRDLRHEPFCSDLLLNLLSNTGGLPFHSFLRRSPHSDTSRATGPQQEK